MKRSDIFISILMGLFIFQSLWNVSAAFCAHESKTAVIEKYTTHFGHHESSDGDAGQELEVETQQIKSSISSLISADHIKITLDDHHDHLPSFSHFIIVEAQPQTERQFLIDNQSDRLNYMNNFYTSPHLDGINPPPEFVPLLAG